MSSDIVVIDYGVGNVASIRNMLKKAGYDSELSGDPDVIANAGKVILPGVGAFDRAARILRESGLRDVVIERANAGVPLLGVCLGMQLLLDSSEEGERAERGLGLIPGMVRRFPSEIEVAGLKVPHMGWNTIERVSAPGVLTSAQTGNRYYFVHSFFADPTDPAHRLGVSRHGIDFTSMVHRDNVIGVQFHPEKSHRTGIALLSDFARQ